MKISRRNFLAGSVAAVGARSITLMPPRTGGRLILTLVYDKGLGMMRAVERIVP